MNEALLFTVRVWRQAEQFRAVVRAVGDEQTHLFTAAAPLADFLVSATAEGPRPGDDGVSPQTGAVPPTP